MRRGFIILLCVLATTFAVTQPASLSGALESWQNLAAKVSTLR